VGQRGNDCSGPSQPVDVPTRTECVACALAADEPDGLRSARCPGSAGHGRSGGLVTEPREPEIELFLAELLSALPLLVPTARHVAPLVAGAGKLHRAAPQRLDAATSAERPRLRQAPPGPSGGPSQ
jgi:hypothetical protein